jgi:hypothetical protein
MQRRLALSRPAEDVAALAVLLDLPHVALDHLPALDLPRCILSVTVAQCVRIGQKLRANDGRSIARKAKSRGVQNLAGSFCLRPNVIMPTWNKIICRCCRVA